MDRHRARRSTSGADFAADESPIPEVRARRQSLECAVAHEILDRVDTIAPEADRERSEELQLL